MHTKKLFLAGRFAGLALLVACTERPTESSADISSPNLAAAVAMRADEVYPMEEDLARLAREIPGFGGMAYDGRGNAIIRLVDLRQRSIAVRAIEPLARAEAAREGRPGAPELIVRQGRYEFMQLVRWRNRMTEAVLAVPGVMYAGIGYGENRLTIGLAPARAAGAREAVRGAVSRLGIPTEAVLFDIGAMSVPAENCTVTDPTCTEYCTSEPCGTNGGEDPCVTDPSLEGCPEPYPGDGDISPTPEPSFSYSPDPNYVYAEPSVYSLTSTVRPLRGAVRISKGSGGGCSIGFIADYDGRRIFSSGSHCSVSMMWLDGTEWHQPEVVNNSYTKFVGRESADPQANVYNARYSDVAFNGVAAGVGSSLGYISRTRGGPVTGAFAVGTLEIDPAAPQLRVGGEGSLVENQYFEKLGSRTGWTRGKASRPCQNVSQYGRTFYCSTWVSAGADHGDSGGPVFRSYLGSSCKCVYLVGIAFATTRNGGLWLSPMSGIRRDFGAQGSQAGRLRTY